MAASITLLEALVMVARRHNLHSLCLPANKVQILAVVQQGVSAGPIAHHSLANAEVLLTGAATRAMCRLVNCSCTRLRPTSGSLLDVAFCLLWQPKEVVRSMSACVRPEVGTQLARR